MIESLLITLREGLEIALVVGVMASVLRQRGESHLFRSVWWGVGIGLSLSVATVGIMVTLLSRWLSGEIFEGVMFFTTAVFVAGMAVWVSRTGHRLKRAVAVQLEGAASSGWTLVIMTALLVWREGTEVVLMLRSASGVGGIMAQSIGAVAGAAVAGLAGWQMVRGSVRLPLASIMRVSAWVLWALVGLFAISGVHELAESGVLRISRFWWTGIGVVALHGWAVVAGGTLIATAVEWSRVNRTWPVPSMAAAAGVALVIGSWMSAHSVQAVSGTLVVREGAITLPVGIVTDRASWFTYPSAEGASRRLLAIRRPDGVVVAFDTCQNCLSGKGYRQEGEELICTHCGAESVPADLGRGLTACMPAFIGGPYARGVSDPRWSVEDLDRRYQEYVRGGEW